MKFRSMKAQGFAATRARLGLTQHKLADQLGISRTTIAMVECGRRNLPVPALLKLAELEIKIAAAAIPGTVPTKEGRNTDLSTTQNL